MFCVVVLDSGFRRNDDQDEVSFSIKLAVFRASGPAETRTLKPAEAIAYHAGAEISNAQTHFKIS